MSEEPRQPGFGGKPQKVKVVKVVIVTAATEKLFWFMLGVFLGCNWLMAMVIVISWAGKIRQ